MTDDMHHQKPISQQRHGRSQSKAQTSTFLVVKPEYTASNRTQDDWFGKQGPDLTTTGHRLLEMRTGCRWLL